MEKWACGNSRTVPVGQLTWSSWRSSHHEVKSLHFRAYCFLIEGALDWRMVSTTFVERPEAMSCTSSGATPTTSRAPGRERSGEKRTDGGVRENQRGHCSPESQRGPPKPGQKPSISASVMEESHFSLHLVLTPNLLCGRRRHFDVEPPSALIELEFWRILMKLQALTPGGRNHVVGF